VGVAATAGAGVSDLAWQDDAACGGVPLEEFFPPPGPVPPTRDGRRWCRRCPVRQQCLDYAMQVELQDRRYGLWGGLQPAQRKQLQEASA